MVILGISITYACGSVGTTIHWGCGKVDSYSGGLLTVVRGMPDGYHNMKLKDDGLSCATPSAQDGHTTIKYINDAIAVCAV